MSTTSGPHLLEVGVADSLIAGSPFRVNISAGPTFALMSVAEGAGLKASNIGMATRVIVYAKDRFGNNVTVGGVPFDAAFSEGADDPIPTPAAITDMTDGRYIVEYKPVTMGRSLLSIGSSRVTMVRVHQMCRGCLRRLALPRLLS
jgi:hypothetical protein